MHRLYETEDISVFWNSDKCRHAKQCVQGCPEAFDINRKPWIHIDEAPADKVWKAISKCPSGALAIVYNHGIKIIYEADAQRSAAYLEDRLIGECDYEETENGWRIFHTEVDPEFGGKGIAKRLVYRVVQEAERNKAEVIPSCSYARRILNL